MPGSAPDGLVVAETARLRLRRLTEGDAAFMLRLLNEPGFLANIGDKGVRTLDDAVTHLRTGPLDSYAVHGFGMWRMDRKSDGLPLGLCGLLRRHGMEDVEVGYALLAEHEGQGYTSEAALACRDLALTVFGLPRIVAIVTPGNSGSERILQKLGLTYQGLRDVHPGQPPVAFYA